MTQKPLLRLIILFVAVLAADQLTKYIALTTLTIGQPVDVIGSLVRWTLAYNPGGAFGMRLGSSNYYLITSLLIFCALVVYIYRNRFINYVAIPLSLVAGGAIGNIIDRIRFGEVVDFIDCEFPDFNMFGYEMYRWPIFNVADMAVSCGIIATIILILYHSRKEAIAQRAALESDDGIENNPSVNAD
ncbi:MAG: signal peptidase II [Candidatus Zixiibacteriota bacterium]